MPMLMLMLLMPRPMKMMQRRQTRPTFGMEPPGWEGDAPAARALLQGGVVASRELGASRIWGDGFTGKGVRVAVFDTGVRADHPACAPGASAVAAARGADAAAVAGSATSASAPTGRASRVWTTGWATARSWRA
jgi:subtilisin family serine protease